MTRLLAALILVALAAVLLGGLFLVGLRVWVDSRYDDRIYKQPADLAPESLELGALWPAAIVFGAGYYPGGYPSEALTDRLETAIELYQAGLVNKLLLTGDNRFVDYNEPAVMASYAEARGIPREDLVLDYAGRRTYDSCYRARVIFGLERAVLVTQAFHLPRALYTCDRLDLEVVGIEADRRPYIRSRWYELRELFALARAWIDLNLSKPLPVLGDPIPIDWDRRSGAGS